MTRRSLGSPDKKAEPKKEQESETRKRKSSQQVEVAAETSRPKRNIRKSALLSSGDYEVSFPGVNLVKEEDEELEEEGYDEQPLSPEVEPVVASSRPVQQKGRPRRPPPSITPIQRDERSDVEIDLGRHGSLDELTEDDDMGLIDIDNLATEVDVETMSNLEEADQDEGMRTFEYEENEEPPPTLERASDAKRKRGRPRKYPQGQTPFRRTNSTPRPRTQVQRDPAVPAPRNKYVYDKPLTKIEAEKINSFNVKLFDDHIGETENGDRFATVIPGCLSYLLRKERIIEILTNRAEISTIRMQGWMMNKPPRLPPLSTLKVCYAFYIEGNAITSIRDLSSDDLKPWTTSSNDPAHNEPVVKPNVRKHPIERQGGRLVPIKGDPRGAEIHLTEYSAWLPRCLRLRKKIFYLSRAGHIIGNVLILYDFTCPGDIPVLLNVVHGNEAFRGTHTDEEFERGHMLFVGDNENPFEEDMVSGPRGERFFSVRPDRYGWTNNKKLLLKWLVNEPALLDAPGAVNARIPYLPPLIEGRGVFVFFAPANIIADQLHFTGDGLSPWTYQGAAVNHRVRTVKKALVQDSLGHFHQSKEEWQATGLALVETITILCRCPRLRKRIIYVQRSNTSILGNVAWIYEYMQPGPIPEIIKQNNRASASSHLPAEMLMSRHQMKTERPGIGNDDEIDVEELVEEVVSDDLHHNGLIGPNYGEEVGFDELPEDSLNGGWDTEFEEDVLVSQESTSPFFEGVRTLEDGHTYLTVRHKRVLCNSDTILEFIANSNFVDEKDLMNTSKPSHPPLVRNARAYVFFVSGHVVFPHDINRDDFSPWSANATPDRPTCYRSKVRKFGVINESKTGRYILQDGDYKLFPFHLVSLYSIHPKEDRLRKRIHYLMETSTKTIVSHVMIMYDYNQEGLIPRINGPYGKRMIKRRPLRRLHGEMTEVVDDVSDESESEKPSPFGGSPQTTENGDIYMAVDDIDFLNDRNRQLHYLVNKPHLLDQSCINQRLPQFPPLIRGKGAFVFFIDGNVDSRMLTCDSLGPWSENITLLDGSVMCRRPKTHRILLGLNRLNHLRVVRTKKYPPQDNDFQMHVYAATLPRCPRLKKRVVYVTKDNQQLGSAMIAYWYSEEGDPPQQAPHGNAVHTDSFYSRLPPPLKEEARQLLLENMPVQDVLKELQGKHNVSLHLRSIYNIRRELRVAGLIPADPNEVTPKDVKDSIAAFDTEDSMADYLPPEWTNQEVNALEEDQVVRSRRLQPQHLPSRLSLDSQHLFRYVKNSMGCRNDVDAFDAIWKALVIKDEQRILRNIKTDFGVEIVADHVDHVRMQDQDQIVDGAIIHEEILEGEIVAEQILADGEILEEEVVMDDGSMMLMREERIDGESLLLQEPVDASESEPKSHSPVDAQH